MREIKFRAWDTEAKKMYRVSMLDFCEWNICIVDENNFYKNGDRNSFKNEDTDRCFLMQYTGLKDIDGVEVFEGDIVSYDLGIDGEKPENYKIIFDNKQCAYFLFPLKDGARLRHFTYSAQSDCEVIGNIYEHKHLLGGE